MANPGFGRIATYLRRVCPTCLGMLAHRSDVSVDTLLAFLWADRPLSLAEASSVLLAVHQIASSDSYGSKRS